MGVRVYRDTRETFYKAFPVERAVSSSMCRSHRNLGGTVSIFGVCAGRVSGSLLVRGAPSIVGRRAPGEQRQRDPPSTDPEMEDCIPKVSV